MGYTFYKTESIYFDIGTESQLIEELTLLIVARGVTI